MEDDALFPSWPWLARAHQRGVIRLGAFMKLLPLAGLCESLGGAQPLSAACAPLCSTPLRTVQSLRLAAVRTHYTLDTGLSLSHTRTNTHTHTCRHTSAHN